MNEEATGPTEVSWSASITPPFPDGYPGPGVGHYDYRYDLNGAGWTQLAETSNDSFEIEHGSDGEALEVEVIPVARSRDGTGEGVKADLNITGPVLTPENIGSEAPGEENEPVEMWPEPEEADDTRGAATRGVAPQLQAASSDSTYEQHPCKTAEPCGSYEPKAAAAYAAKWSLKDSNGLFGDPVEERDKNFDYLGGQGGDCTNFASAALHAGGMQFMRSHGDDNPDGELATKGDSAEFVTGEGAWWSYWYNVTTEFGPEREYEVTKTFVRAGELELHLKQYGLARRIYGWEHIKPGDLIFYDLFGAELGQTHTDHTQVVTRVTDGQIFVAQHSEGYEETLKHVISRVTKEKLEEEDQDWTWEAVEPTHTQANIPLGST